jgi:hypothetical protein
VLRHEVLTWHGRQHFEHGLVQHLPAAQLLLDHVAAGLFYIHIGF